jgi:tRNA A37 threonylcarbamoyladenosine biosynthesis protein TsaE
MKFTKKSRVIETNYIVLYGGKNIKDRNKRSFPTFNGAMDLFREKEQMMHVDMYKEEIVTTWEKISPDE